MTLQPNVEDLLASIRKAIDRQTDGPPRRTLDRGAEMMPPPEPRSVPPRNFSSRPSPASSRPLALRHSYTDIFDEPEAPLAEAPPAEPLSAPVELDSGESDPSWQPEEPAPSAGTGVSLLSSHALDTANAAFGQLADTLMSRATGQRSIEDLTQELLRSMLKQWLDANLPEMVERLVREEIERVARRGGRR